MVTVAISNIATVENVTECADTWSILGFLLTSSYFAIYLAFALSKDSIWTQFYGWIGLPVSITAMCLSFALKPRRTDSKYKAFLYFQYALLTVGVEVNVKRRGMCVRA